MNRFTQEDAERCARACGWEFVAQAAVGPVWFYGDTIDDWVPTLSLDPYFWFPRLWERLKARLGVMGAAELRYCPKYRTGVSIDVFNAPYKPGTVEWSKTFTGDECISLCAAIEALEEKK